jgi:hypothetical protein
MNLREDGFLVRECAGVAAVVTSSRGVPPCAQGMRGLLTAATLRNLFLPPRL